MAFDFRSSYRDLVLAILGAVSLASAPSLAEVRSVDPDAAIDGDLMGEQPSAPVEMPGSAVDASSGPWIDISPEPIAGNGTPIESGPVAGVATWDSDDLGATQQAQGSAGIPTDARSAAADNSTTFGEDDLIGAAEGVFGKGAKGLASVIEGILGKQGEPNGYIVGREGGGAFAVGVRYGSGNLHHKIEGERPVYWTGPSLGFDLGANAAKAFVLVYNLHDSQDLFKRFGSGEGQAYFVGGFNVSYLRRGDVVLIPVRMGAGLRLGANVGYMKFSEKQRWLPF